MVKTNGKKTNSTKKKMLSKDAISDTKTDDRLFMVFCSIQKDGSLPKDIPRGSIYRYTKILKDKRVIKKDGYTAWVIDDKEKAIKFREDYYQKHAIISGSISGGVTSSHLPFTDKRGHRLLLTITTPALNLKKLKTHFNWKCRGKAVWKDGGGAGKYLRLWFGGAKFNLYENKTQVEFNKSFYSSLHITTEDMAQVHYKAVLTTFENNIPQSVRIGKELLVRASMEFEKMNSNFAKYCFEQGLDIRFTAGDFKYWQDKSGGTMNEEGNNATTMDALEGVAQVSVMKTVVEYANLTDGRNILQDLTTKTVDIQNIVTSLTNLVKIKIESDITTHQQSLNIPKTPEEIEDIQKKHKDLPSYFG